MRTFFVIWVGQLISMLGSGLTAFALGVYIYQRTGSATQLGLSLLAATLPALLLAPLAGALVDRWDRRWAMILSDTGAGLSTLVIWLLLSSGRLEVWHIYMANAVNSMFGTFQRPAYMAATTLLVPKKHYGRAAGLSQVAGAISQIVAPLLAGFLIVLVQIEGIILVDFATYAVATLTLLVIRIPRPEATAESEAAKGTLWHEAAFGWIYLKARPGLLGLLLLFAFVNFALGFYGTLFTPLILSFSTADVLGTIFSVGGIGMLVGSLVMSAWGGSRRKINSLMAAMFVSGFCLSLAGLRANPILIGVSTFVFFAMLPVANGSSQAIWQAKVAPDVQGRVFAIRGMIAVAASPIAYLLAGPLADYVFEPFMASGNALSVTVGQLTGTGAGRGIGLIFLAMGMLISAATAIVYLYPRIRLVEDELPDHETAMEVVAQAPPAAEAAVPAS